LPFLFSSSSHRAKLSSHFLESLRMDQQWLNVKALLSYAALKFSRALRIYTWQ
jgi:hypothetical protein